MITLCWPKVHTGFSVRCHGKPGTNFVANPILHMRSKCRIVVECEASVAALQSLFRLLLLTRRSEPITPLLKSFSGALLPSGYSIVALLTSPGSFCLTTPPLNSYVPSTFSCVLQSLHICCSLCLGQPSTLPSSTRLSLLVFRGLSLVSLPLGSLACLYTPGWITEQSLVRSSVAAPLKRSLMHVSTSGVVPVHCVPSVEGCSVHPGCQTPE